MQQSNYEIRVGLFALFALILLVWGWAWLKSFSLFSQPQRFTAEFNDVAGLSNNATVNVSGVRVGTVEFIDFTPQRKIHVHLKITREGIRIPVGSHISIQTLGMVGAKYVEILLPADALGNPLPADQTKEIADNTIITHPDVQDPVRVELVINRVATRVDEIVSSIDTQAASQAINNLSSATKKLNANMDRLESAADSVSTASANIQVTSNKFGQTAERASEASEEATTFFSTGNSTLHDISALTRDFRGTSGRVNKILENPAFAGDMKEAMIQARQTAETIRSAMGDMSTTLKDKGLREEVMALLTRLQQSTENIKTSMDIVNKMSADEALRGDLKDIVRQAKDAMTQANTLLADPEFKTDVRSTLTRVRSAATNLDVTSKQVQQILNKRAPLLHLLFGRPGKLPQVAPLVVPQSVPVPGTPAP